MKKICLALFILILSSSCIFSKGEGYKRISMDEAKTLMEKEEGYILLDVRTKGEYEIGYIPGAKFIKYFKDFSSPMLVRYSLVLSLISIKVIPSWSATAFIA